MVSSLLVSRAVADRQDVEQCEWRGGARVAGRGAPPFSTGGFYTMANDAEALWVGSLGSSPSPELGSGPIAYFCLFFETWTGDPLPVFHCPMITLRFDNLISMWRNTV